MNNNEKLATTNQNQQVAPMILLGDGSSTPTAPKAAPAAAPQPVDPKGGKGRKVRAKRPGRGFGISAFVLGILAMLLVFVSLFDTIFFPVTCGLGIAFAIMAIIFAAIGKKKGDISGFSTAGLVMGIVPLGLFGLMITACAGCMACFGAMMASAA